MLWNTFKRGTHSADANLLSDLGLLVNIDLEEFDIVGTGGLGHLLEDGRDRTARTAPGGPEVNDNDFAGVNLQGFISMLLHAPLTDNAVYSPAR